MSSYPQGPLIPPDLSVTDAVFNGDVVVFDSISATTMTAVSMDVGSLVVDSISATTMSTLLFTAGSVINSTSTTLGFFGATPVVQVTTAVTGSAYVQISSTTSVGINDTFQGYTINQMAIAMKNYGLLD